jgi:ethanolamine utilization microcompartment shell protein EutL
VASSLYGANPAALRSGLSPLMVAPSSTSYDLRPANNVDHDLVFVTNELSTILATAAPVNGIGATLSFLVADPLSLSCRSFPILSPRRPGY